MKFSALSELRRRLFMKGLLAQTVCAKGMASEVDAAVQRSSQPLTFKYQVMSKVGINHVWGPRHHESSPVEVHEVGNCYYNCRSITVHDTSVRDF
jgi:hypothetical protein